MTSSPNSYTADQKEDMARELEEGIAGFGETPWQAMQAFHTAMLSERAK